MNAADNPYPDESRVWTRYPAPGQPADTPRETWPWYEAEVAERCGPDEWLVTLRARELAAAGDGSLWYPQAFRDSGEIRPAPAQDGRHPDE